MATTIGTFRSPWSNLRNLQIPVCRMCALNKSDKVGLFLYVSWNQEPKDKVSLQESQTTLHSQKSGYNHPWNLFLLAALPETMLVWALGVLCLKGILMTVKHSLWGAELKVGCGYQCTNSAEIAASTANRNFTARRIHMTWTWPKVMLIRWVFY